MRAQADAGNTVEIVGPSGELRYIFMLINPASHEPLSRLLGRATKGLQPSRDKWPVRRA